MAENPDIRCDICGHKFNVVEVPETIYDEYRAYDSIAYYPDPKEKAHLVLGYICDDCYNKFPDAIKQQFIVEGNKYINDLGVRLADLEKDYVRKRDALIRTSRQLRIALNQLNTAERFLDIKSEIRDILLDRQPGYSKGPIYFDKVLSWEKEHYLKQNKVYLWEKKYDLEIEQYPQGVSSSDWVTEQEFFDILVSSVVKHLTPLEVLTLIIESGKSTYKV